MNSLIFSSLFILVLLGSLFLGHFFIYLFLIKFFHISKFSVKIYISVILLILGTSFVLSSILLHYNNNIYSQNYYFLSGLWLGFIVNINILILILYLLNFIFSRYNIFEHKLFIGMSLIFVSIIYSGYGVYNAFVPFVNEITIKIKNLPQNWDNKKIVMISDVHLGNIYQNNFMKKIVDKINILNPEVIFIVGDLFDGMDGNIVSHVEPLNNLKSKKGIFFITGNHETYLGVDDTVKILKNMNLKVLSDEKINLDGIELIGISYPERGSFKDMKGTLQKLNLDPKKPKILLYHSPTHLNEAEKAGIDLQLSGHTHRGQQFPFNIITYLVYSGHDYGLTKIGNFQIYTSVGVGTWGPAMRTNSRSEIVEITLKK